MSADNGSLGLEYFENQRKVTPEMLEPYRGQHIAWSWDGSTILAGAATFEELLVKLQHAGHDRNRVVFDQVDPPEIGGYL